MIFGRVMTLASSPLGINWCHNQPRCVLLPGMPQTGTRFATDACFHDLWPGGGRLRAFPEPTAVGSQGEFRRRFLRQKCAGIGHKQLESHKLLDNLRTELLVFTPIV